MTDIASLALVVDSRDVGTAVSRLGDLTGAGARAEAQTDRLSHSHRRLAGETTSSANASRLFAGAVASIGLVAAAQQVGRLADSYTGFTNQLKVAGIEGANLTRTQDALFKSAQRAGAPLEALGTLYGRGAQAAKDLGATQAELLTFTDLVATSLKVGGRSATESSGALLQLSQVMGSGKVQAEEYNSLIDGLRPLLIAVASGSDRFGGSVSRLTNLVRASKVTSSEFFDAALKGKDVLDAMAAKTVPTLTQSFIRLDNAMGQFIGRSNDAYSVTARISSGIDLFSTNLDKIVPVLGIAIGYVGIRWAAAGAQFVATEASRVAAIGASINAERTAAVSAAQLSTTRIAAQTADITATQAAIGFSRQEAVARLQTANVTIAANRGVLAGTYAVTLAEQQRSVALRELAVLGTQAAAVNGRLAATNIAAAAATTSLAGAQRVATASMVGLRGAAGGLLALMGGPWGVAILAAGASVYFLHRALTAADRANGELKTSLGGAKTALDEYELAALDAAGQTGKAAVAAKAHAEALRQEAAAAVTAARALREKSVAEAEAADATAARTRTERVDRIKATAFSGDPMAAALAATVPEALAERRATQAKTRAEVATDAAAAAEVRYQKILAGSTAAVTTNAAAEDKKTAKKRDATDATGDFITKLQQEIEEVGKTEKQQRLLEIARAVSDAPLAKQKTLIRQLGDEREAALAAAAAWETLTAMKVANAERTLTPLQKTRRDNTVAVNDAVPVDPAIISAVGEATKLAAENAERWAMALAAVPREIKSTETAMREAFPNGDISLLSLERDLDALQLLERQATQAAANIADAFGGAGVAIGAALQTFSNYRTTEAALGVQVAKGEKTQAQATTELRNARVRGYGDMAKAAKSYFNEGSAGYKVLQVAEIAFRTVETLNTIQAMALDGAHTVASVANSGVRGAADGVAAYAKTMASVPFPFNLAAGATVLAALAAVGVAIAGGGGGGGAPKIDLAEQRQNGQGAGSVLGDKTTKSESLAKALSIAASNTNRDLEYSSQMVRSLRSIDSNIGSLAAVLARQLGVTGGAFDTTGLNLGTRGKSGLFGSKTTTSLQDQGIRFGDQTIGDITAGGLQGQTYADVVTKTKKKFFGLTTSNRSSTSTTSADLDGGIEDEFTRVIASLRDGVLAAAGVLGIEGAAATIDAFKLSLGTISLKDLKGDELEAALQAVFGKAADQITTAVLPAVTKFQKVGEGAFETITRLARGYQVIDVSLQAIGKTFSLVGVGSIEARERLIELAGGIDALLEGTASFADNFLSEAERIAPIQKAVTAEMARLGFESVTSKEAFKNLVLGIDVTTEAGALLYGSLLILGPAFAKTADYARDLIDVAADLAQTNADKRVDDATKTLDGARTTLTDVFQREAAAHRSRIDAFKSVASSLSAFGAKLTDTALAERNPAEQLAAAKAAFARADVAVKANPGDRDAYATLQSAGEALVSASREASTTDLAFNTDLAAVRRSVSAAEVTATAQVDVAQQQLEQMTQAVDQLLGLNKAIIGLGVAINGFATATAALADAQVIAKAVAAANIAATTVAANTNTAPATATGAVVAPDTPAVIIVAPPTFFTTADPNAALIAEIKALKDEVAGMRSEQKGQLSDIAKTNDKTAQVLVRTTRDGEGMVLAA